MKMIAMLASFKKTYAVIKKNPRYFIKIILLDLIFAAIFAAISILFLQAIVAEASMMIETMQTAVGADAVARISSSSGDVAQYALSTLKLMLLFMTVTLVLFAMLFGYTSYLIVRVNDKKIRFFRYVRQFAMISAAAWLVLLVLSIFLGNLVAGIVLDGFTIYHSFKFMLLALILSMTTYLSAVSFSCIPQKRAKDLLRKAYAAAFKDARKNLSSFLMILFGFSIIIYLIMYASDANQALGLFVTMLLLFPYLSFARLFMIETLKR